MRYDIRPMSLGEMLDTGFRLVRNHLELLLGIAAALYLPLAIPPMLFGSGAYAPSEATIALWLIVALLYLLASPVVTVAITHALGELYLGRTPSIGDSLREGVRLLLPVFGTSILLYLALGLGFLLLVIPGIYLSLAFLLVWQVMVLEHLYGTRALHRSRELMRGNFGRGFAILLVAGLIISVLLTGVALVAGAVPVIGPLADAVVRSLALAYGSAVTVLLYFDIRCRKEGFDVEHLSRLLTEDAGAESRVER